MGPSAARLDAPHSMEDLSIRSSTDSNIKESHSKDQLSLLGGDGGVGLNSRRPASAAEPPRGRRCDERHGLGSNQAEIRSSFNPALIGNQRVSSGASFRSPIKKLLPRRVSFRDSAMKEISQFETILLLRAF